MRSEAFARPLRTRILSELGARGSLRATDIAAALDVPANQAGSTCVSLRDTDWWRRTLAAAQDRRDRVWRAVDEDGYVVDLRALESAPGGSAVIDGFRRQSTTWAHALVDAAHRGDRPADEMVAVMETSLRLTKEEAADLSDQIAALIIEADHRQRSSASGDDCRRTCVFWGALQPLPPP